MRLAYISFASLALIAACDTSGTSIIALAGGTAATHVLFRVPPTGSAAGAAITPAVVVVAATSSGATDTTYKNIISVAIGSGSSGSGTLSGTTSVVATAGQASFGDLKISAAGTYTLSASAPSLSGATSSPFAITP